MGGEKGGAAAGYAVGPMQGRNYIGDVLEGVGTMMMPVDGIIKVLRK